MTTIAYDGRTMVADTLVTDGWGMKELVRNKIWANVKLLVGAAGDHGDIHRWMAANLHDETNIGHLLNVGYPSYSKNDNDPSIIVVNRTNGAVYRHTSGVFVRVSRPFHAVGSGRDYALAAMHLGHDALEAVRAAAEFDVHTGGRLVKIPVKGTQVHLEDA
jgi:hypothetical protein